MIQTYKTIMFRLRAFLEGLATAKTAAWNARAVAWKRMEMEETTMFISIAEPIPEPTDSVVKVDREEVVLLASAKEEVERAALNAHLPLEEYISRYYYGLVAEHRIVPYSVLNQMTPSSINSDEKASTTNELRIKAFIESWKVREG